MDGDLLKGKLQIQGYSIPQTVSKLKEEGVSITPSTFYKKLRGDSQFHADEIIGITKIANLTRQEMMDIFFNELVS